MSKKIAYLISKDFDRFMFSSLKGICIIAILVYFFPILLQWSDSTCKFCISFSKLLGFEHNALISVQSQSIRLLALIMPLVCIVYAYNAFTKSEKVEFKFITFPTYPICLLGLVIAPYLMLVELNTSPRAIYLHYYLTDTYGALLGSLLIYSSLGIGLILLSGILKAIIFYIKKT